MHAIYFPKEFEVFPIFKNNTIVTFLSITDEMSWWWDKVVQPLSKVIWQ